MALRKKVLIQFLYDTRDRLILRVKENYLKKIEVEKEKIYQSLNIDDKLVEHQKMLNKIQGFQSKLTESNFVRDMGIKVNSQYHDSPINRLRYVIGTKYTEKTKNILNYDNVPLIKILSDEMERDCDTLKDSYRDLISVCNSMSSGKKVQEYLEGLGYDLTELKKSEDETVAIANPIDTSKLGIELANNISKVE